jgi:fructose-1,6-bisphosphatase/inositol monophosphatase family enzyme
VDGVACLKPARSVDIAAAQLLVRERGLAIELFDDPPFGAGLLDLGQRSRVAAAASDALVADLAAAMR